MRIDLFLKQSRIVKRRTIAKQMCDDGFVFLNNIRAKAQSNVKVGDILTIYFPSKKINYKILAIPEKVLSKNESALLYDK